MKDTKNRKSVRIMEFIDLFQLVKELEDETGQLSKEIKRLNFGQFLFLYFVASNAPFSFVQELLYELKIKGAPEWVRSAKKEQKEKKKKPHTNEKVPLQDMSTCNSDLGHQSNKSSAPNLPSVSNSQYETLRPYNDCEGPNPSATAYPNLEEGNGDSGQATLKIKKILC